MTFHDYPKRGSAVVMDGSRCVATCRSIVSGGYLVKVHAGCWIDPRARTGGIPGVGGKFPGLMHLPTRREAVALLRGLVGGKS